MLAIPQFRLPSAADGSASEERRLDFIFENEPNASIGAIVVLYCLWSTHFSRRNSRNTLQNVLPSTPVPRPGRAECTPNSTNGGEDGHGSTVLSLVQQETGADDDSTIIVPVCAAFELMVSEAMHVPEPYPHGIEEYGC